MLTTKHLCRINNSEIRVMLGLLILYLIILGLFCFEAFRLAPKAKRSAVSLDQISEFQSSEKWSVFLYWFLGIYFANSLIVEMIARYWYFYYPEIIYSPIYAVGLIVSVLPILIFLDIQSRSEIVSILFFIFFGLLIAYFRDERGSFESDLTFIFGFFISILFYFSSTLVLHRMKKYQLLRLLNFTI